MTDEQDQRLVFIGALNEDAFRKIFLVPLLFRVGYREVIEYHGTAEKGKDVICWYHDPLQRRRYVALVVKRGDIRGAVGKSGNASEVLYQVQQALNEPYRDIYGLAELRINECIVATSGVIKNTAIESISGTLRGTDLDRLVSFIDQRLVVDLVTQHMPEFWLNDQYTLTLLHELRSPLSAIAGAADYLRSLADRDNVDISKLRRIAEQINADVEAAQQLAERQYELRNPTSTINLAPLDVSSVLRDAVQRFGRSGQVGSGPSFLLTVRDRTAAHRRRAALVGWNPLFSAVVRELDRRGATPPHRAAP